VIVVLLT